MDTVAPFLRDDTNRALLVSYPDSEVVG
jgi:hypothetical protein